MITEEQAERKAYRLNHPIPIAIGLASIICPFLLAFIPGVFNDFSINFLPGALEYVWLLIWFMSGALITQGIFRLDKPLEMFGWGLYSTITLVYCIAIVYTASFINLLLIGSLPAIGIGAIAWIIIRTKTIKDKRENIKWVQKVEAGK